MVNTSLYCHHLQTRENYKSKSLFSKGSPSEISHLYYFVVPHLHVAPHAQFGPQVHSGKENQIQQSQLNVFCIERKGLKKLFNQHTCITATTFFGLHLLEKLVRFKTSKDCWRQILTYLLWASTRGSTYTIWTTGAT